MAEQLAGFLRFRAGLGDQIEMFPMTPTASLGGFGDLRHLYAATKTMYEEMEMSGLLTKLIDALRKRAWVRRAVPKPHRTTPCMMPLDDRITPSGAGSASLVRFSILTRWILIRAGLPWAAANLIAFDSNTPTIAHAKVGMAHATLTVGGTSGLYRDGLPAGPVVDLQFDATGGEDLGERPTGGSDRSERINTEDLPNAAALGAGGHVKVFDGRSAANSDSDWKYVTVRRTAAVDDVVLSRESGDRSAPCKPRLSIGPCFCAYQSDELVRRLVRHTRVSARPGA